ncbi:hypothetical protein [Vibrio gallaecicus]|uniref:hypothetical protein n=1 Tax=Vibrio gallaecicus TaxID=552386 RepID=UPI0025B46F15|nr:hypothetical protein [Vibrio gallaecicus]MDN3615986.1 hypothetical protein [Vibrio gallaecicus]
MRAAFFVLPYIYLTLHIIHSDLEISTTWHHLTSIFPIDAFLSQGIENYRTLFL